MNFLKGKLTYTIAGVSVIWAIVGYFLGYLDPAVSGNIILAGLGTFGLRRAIK